jgi:hypothetical protein
VQVSTAIVVLMSSCDVSTVTRTACCCCPCLCPIGHTCCKFTCLDTPLSLDYSSLQTHMSKHSANLECEESVGPITTHAAQSLCRLQGCGIAQLVAPRPHAARAILSPMAVS